MTVLLLFSGTNVLPLLGKQTIRPMRISATSAFVLIILSSVTFFGCEGEKKQNRTRSVKGEVSLGGTLHVASRQLPPSLDPIHLRTNAAVEVGVHFLEGLVRLDPTSSKIIPGVARSWSVDESKSAYVFSLNEDVRFHSFPCNANSSRELTAKDVVYSFERLTKEADSLMFRSTLGGKLKGADEFRDGKTETIAGLVVIDDYSIKIELEQPDESFLFILAQPSLGIVSKEMGLNCKGHQLVGSGPFQLASDQPLLLTRFEDYHRKDEFGNQFPYLDTLTFVVLPSNSEQLEAFFDGTIDAVFRLEIDPVRMILEQHISEFSGQRPKYIMKREAETASYETYSIHKAEVKGLSDGFMGYRDFTQVQIEQ
jgi:ABC-type transport system substrate-binding protein